MALTFWLLCAFVLYVYVGYPVLLHAWARLCRRSGRGRAQTLVDRTPSVSIVIAGRDEGARISTRVDNLRQLDYPASRRQIVIVSDGSTDNTREILEQMRGDVTSVDVPAGGKARALNAGVAQAANEILVFADMRQGFAPDALRALVAPFVDPAVGAVSGELVLNGESRDRRSEEERRADEERRAIEDRRHAMRQSLGQRKGRRRWSVRRTIFESTFAEGVGAYWRYEKQIRRDESATGSVVGATGAIYALRRSLWQPLPPDTILDDVLTPMRAVMAGYRVIFEERACAFDRTSSDAQTEGRRKLRTLAGNYQLLYLAPALLLPWRNPAWVQFVSHKVGRLLVPFMLPVLFALSFFLAPRSALYAAAFVAQGLFYVLAAYGAWLERGPRQAKTIPATAAGAAVPVTALNRIARVALIFLVMNKSAIAGLGALLTRQKVWR